VRVQAQKHSTLCCRGMAERESGNREPRMGLDPREQRAMEFADRRITCATCGTSFLFSAGEQAFYRDRGFRNEPKRCKACKARRLPGKPPLPETAVTCAQCGAATSVPFIPIRNEPVYCRDCFKIVGKAAHARSAGARAGAGFEHKTRFRIRITNEHELLSMSAMRVDPVVALRKE